MAALYVAVEPTSGEIMTWASFEALVEELRETVTDTADDFDGTDNGVFLAEIASEMNAAQTLDAVNAALSLNTDGIAFVGIPMRVEAA